MNDSSQESFRPVQDQELVGLLCSADDRDRKDALQAVCEALEKGFELHLDRNLFLASLLAQQRLSKDPVVRRWFYKYIGLARLTSYLPVLLAAATTEDDHTTAWVIGAVCAIMGLDDGREELRKRGVDVVILDLAGVFAAYFTPELIDSSSTKRSVFVDEELPRRWASFLNVRIQDSELKEYVQTLNLDPESEVAEFSIWSISRATGEFADTYLHPDDIPSLDARVRRWAYHLIAADPEARNAYADLLSAVPDSEPDERVREGMAQGLIRGRLRGGWREFVKEWEGSESSERVTRILAKAQVQKSGVRSQQVIGPRGKKRRVRGQRLMFGTPRVESTQLEMVYFLAIDTVAYSEASDSDQLTIVTSLLDPLSSDKRLLGMAPDVLTTLFTGDGVILGVRKSENSRVPLDVAMDLQRKASTLFKFEIRAGLHCGSTHVLSMSDGATQLIGHAINEAARVMTGSVPGGLVMSDSYYTDVLHRGRESLPGYRVEPRQIVAKHDRIIPCFEVLPSD